MISPAEFLDLMQFTGGVTGRFFQMLDSVYILGDSQMFYSVLDLLLTIVVFAWAVRVAFRFMDRGAGVDASNYDLGGSGYVATDAGIHSADLNCTRGQDGVTCKGFVGYDSSRSFRSVKKNNKSGGKK